MRRYGRAVKGHLFAEKLYGYGKTAASAEELTDKFKLLIDEMIIPSLKNGLCGFVYTQLSDVEDEINGLYTYDRQVLKVDEKRVKRLNRQGKQAIQRASFKHVTA